MTALTYERAPLTCIVVGIGASISW